MFSRRADTEPDDLTARARIRDAALRRFPRDGHGRTTIRAVASDAGVSPALVLHHFGSKEGLRRACDDHVVAVFRDTKREAMSGDNLGDPGFLAAAYRLAPPILRYLAWSLAVGSEQADALFDEMLDESRVLMQTAREVGRVRGAADPDTQIAVLVTMQLGSLVLHHHLSRALGIDTLSTEGIVAVGRAVVEVLTDGIFTEETGRVAAGAMRQLAADLASGEETQDG